MISSEMLMKVLKLMKTNEETRRNFLVTDFIY